MLDKKGYIHARVHTPRRLGTSTHINIIYCFSTATMIRERASMLRCTYTVYLVDPQYRCLTSRPTRSFPSLSSITNEPHGPFTFPNTFKKCTKCEIVGSHCGVYGTNLLKYDPVYTNINGVTSQRLGWTFNARSTIFSSSTNCLQTVKVTVLRSRILGVSSNRKTSLCSWNKSKN